MSIDERLDVIGRHPFRARFHLRGRERAIVQLHGMSSVRGHAAELFAELDADQQAYAVDVICRWIERELAATV